MLDSNLSNRLDLWGFEQGAMVFRDQSLGAALRLKPLDISTATDERMSEIKTQIRSFLNGLPSGMTLQLVQEIVSGNEARLNDYAGTIEAGSLALTREIAEERLDLLRKLDRDGLLPRRNLYALIRQPFRHTPHQRTFFQLRQPKVILNEEGLRREVEQFDRTAMGVADGFKSLGVEAERLSDADLYALSYNQWNPDRPIDPQLTATTDIRDQIILTDGVIGVDHFLLGRVHHKVISLKNLPEVSFATMAEALGALPFDSRLYLTIEVLDQEKEKASLQTQRRLAYASSVGKKGVADLEAQAKLRDIESLLEEMIQGSERVFRFSLNVLLRSVVLDELDSQVSETLSLIRSLSGAEGMVETVAAFNVFCDFAIPQTRIRERAIKVNTSVLADFMPIFGEWPGHAAPQIMLRSQSGGLVGFDPFSQELTNNNQIVSGGSGAGKSFLCNLILSQALKAKPKIFILDIGGSYKRFTEVLGGQYISLGLASGLSINPFSLDGIDRADTDAVDQKTKLVTSLVEIMTKENSRELGRLERAEVEGLVQELLRGSTDAKLSDLRARLLSHQDKEIVRVGRILSLWCADSAYGKFVDRPTTVELKSDIVCFDLKELEQHKDLQSVCLFLITDLIWREVQRDRTQMKFAIFDECWKLLESEEGAQFIGSVFRTFRKYRASAIAISQTMDDFSKSKIAPAVMPNSSVKWILKQTGADQRSLKEALQLNEREMELIAKLKTEKGSYSESFLLAEDKRSVVRIESTPLEYWLATTAPADLKLLEQVKKEVAFESQYELLRYIAERHPKGAQG